MSTHSIWFCGEIRKITQFLDEKKWVIFDRVLFYEQKVVLFLFHCKIKKKKRIIVGSHENCPIKLLLISNLSMFFFFFFMAK